MYDDHHSSLIDSIMHSMDAGIESTVVLNDKPDERHRALIDSVILSMSMDELKCENPSIECARYVMPLATGLFFLLNPYQA